MAVDKEIKQWSADRKKAIKPFRDARHQIKAKKADIAKSNYTFKTRSGKSRQSLNYNNKGNLRSLQKMDIAKRNGFSNKHMGRTSRYKKH